MLKVILGCAGGWLNGIQPTGGAEALKHFMVIYAIAGNRPLSEDSEIDDS